MNSPPSPPNRRTRRIVVTIAVLVLGPSWCFWPRVDQRFVGTWEWTDNSGTSIVTLSRDGVFKWDSSEAIVDGSTTRWTASNHHLVIGDDVPYLAMKRLIQPLDDILFRTFGRLVMIESDELPIVSISEDEILLRSPYLDDREPGKLRRIRSNQR